MENTRDVEKVISSLRNSDLTGDIPSDVAKNVSSDLTKLLTSVNGVSLLKEEPKNLEVVLPCFIRLIFHSDVDIAQNCLKLCDTVLDIFRSKLPKIKKEGWWVNFENGALSTLIDSLPSKIEADDSWVTIWSFLANVIVTEAFHVRTLNKLLAVTQHAFQKGRDNVEIKDQALLCWRGLIDAFGRSPQILVLNKAINLLIKPLSTLSSATKCQISTWVHLIEVKGLSGPEDIVKSIVEAMCQASFKSGEKSACRTLPDDCTNALITIMSHDHVVEHCLPDIIEVFGACVNSKPSSSLIELLAGVLVQSINDSKDDGLSFKLWKGLLEQHNSCSGNPILPVACQSIFTEINFSRWIDSSTVEGKDIVLLMASQEFREKVLLRSIQGLTYDDQAETPAKRKTRKGSYENVWSNYCEAYVSWWTNYSPPSPNKNGKPEVNQSLKDSCDYKATQFLLLQPIQLDIWNPTIFKTWSLLCEACQNQTFLHTFVSDIFDAADKSNLQLQKAIDVSDCLYKLENEFCKQSTKLLESVANIIFSMEFQNLLDVLNLLETAVLFPEMSSLISKICKRANEKIDDFDQLNGHKIKTKVTKIMRKLELHSNSSEKDKPAKPQRTPFRAQSNFLQRLAKAEEKSKSKSPFLTTIFSSAEKTRNDLENNGDSHDNGATIVDTLRENGVITVDSKPLDDTEIVPIITLPSVLKSSPAVVNGPTEGIVAEKENVILSAVNGVNGAGTPTAGSPKLKITNTREVKTVDASSPTVAKKPKPMAGQKSTPKKVIPAKVSYFDDDANDCIMVPPKPKTTPLTVHQVEMMSKRRTDIPALYQDLSQDTQSQQIPAVQEVTTGVSPRPIQESLDIVLGTPSPQDSAAVSTPEPSKRAGKTCSSAKKLDFNLLSTPPSKIGFMNGSFEEMSPTPEHQNPEGKNSLKLAGAQPDGPKKKADVISSSDKLQNESNESENKKGDDKSGADEKSKRKRKSELAKFSPKLTRSKRSLKSTTPDAKMARLPESDPKLVPAVDTNTGDKLAWSNSPEPVSNSSECFSSVLRAEDKNTSAEEKKCENLPGNGPQGEPILSSKLAEDALPNFRSISEQASQDKPKKGRKRKILDPSDNETPKKAKNSGEDGSNTTKKSDSTKKKKKPFKLGAGGNLENWLVKVDKVSASATEPESKSGNVESLDETAPKIEKVSSEGVPNGGEVVELDNSEEIVPSTQECLVQNHKPVLLVLETKTEEKRHDDGVAIKIEEEDHKVAVPDDANDHSPEKPEGSVLERLSHESPNDDEIALVISPCKRQRRAPSVFRGEGDTYLSKDKCHSTASAEPGEDSKVSRSKNKTASPTSKKRLQPLGGRSAKMLRLATTSANREDNEDIVVTPVRRRESIAPIKYGENWPKGPVEEWVACTPASPYMSPFRSALKKTPGLEENTTPERVRNDSMASPLLSSAKRKRVMFLDPPVTRGLAYDTNSPGGSIHHADVPQGSPYPTWKGDDELRRLQDDVNMEYSPSKRDVERLNSLADLKTVTPKENIEEEASPSKRDRVEPKSQLDLKPYAASEVSDEVRQLIDPAVPTTSVPSPEPDWIQIQEKFKLSEDFTTQLSGVDAQLRSLLVQCFDCANMAQTVDAWKIGDCRRICQLPHSFLSLVKNSNGEILTDTLVSSVFTAPSNIPPPAFSASSAQTEATVCTENSSQTSSPNLKNSDTQTIIKSRSVKTNTEKATTVSSTQADLTRPAVEEWPSLLQDSTPQEALMYFSDSLRVLSSSFPNKKLQHP